VELARTTTTQNGDYVFLVRTSAAAIDLVATAPNDLVASLRGVAITPYGQATADLTLKPSLHISGNVVALDGKTPHVQLVLELVQPAGAEMEFTSTPARTPPIESVRSPTGNRVLRLKNHPSYVELPPAFRAPERGHDRGWVMADQGVLVLRTGTFRLRSGFS
jgi:hypothetical protein